MNSSPIVTFGPFTFDAAGGVLSKDGQPVSLQSQPARVLACLVDRAGEVVTREQLRHEIWGDAWVNFDQGLNYCIRQIRIALDDDARQPSYLQTLPQRGYRFIGGVSHGAEVSTRNVRRPVRTVTFAAAAAAFLLCLGAVVGLQTARTIAREVNGRSGVALSEHLSPLHVARGAFTHHLKPLIVP
jgi:DNA-binding winged helix-turn-helix (wHTH) protein